MNLISVTTDIGLHATQMDNTTPLSKKVKSWIFASSVIVDKEIKKFDNVKRRLVLQRFLIIYCVEKKKMNIKLSFPHWLCKRIVQNLHAAKPEATVILSRAYEAVCCSLKNILAIEKFVYLQIYQTVISSTGKDLRVHNFWRFWRNQKL